MPFDLGDDESHHAVLDHVANHRWTVEEREHEAANRFDVLVFEDMSYASVGIPWMTRAVRCPSDARSANRARAAPAIANSAAAKSPFSAMRMAVMTVGTRCSLIRCIPNAQWPQNLRRHSVVLDGFHEDLDVAEHDDLAFLGKPAKAFNDGATDRI